MHPRINNVNIRVVCDVNIPLTGENDATYIYGPQKGGTMKQLNQQDDNLKHFSKVIKNELGKDVVTIPGVGAAGGLRAGIC